MNARIIYADSESSADMFYAAGLFVPDPFLYCVEESGKSHLVLSVLEVDRGRKEATVDKVHNLNDLMRSKRHKKTVREWEWIASFLAELKIF